MYKGERGRVSQSGERRTQDNIENQRRNGFNEWTFPQNTFSGINSQIDPKNQEHPRNWLTRDMDFVSCNYVTRTTVVYFAAVAELS